VAQHQRGGLVRKLASGPCPCPCRAEVEQTKFVVERAGGLRGAGRRVQLDKPFLPGALLQPHPHGGVTGPNTLLAGRAARIRHHTIKAHAQARATQLRNAARFQHEG